MVGRIEWGLLGLLAVAIAIGVSNQQATLKAKEKKSTAQKEVELIHADAQEVNASGVMNRFRADRAVLIDKVWRLEHFELHNPDILSLRSLRALRSRQAMVLEGNVTLHREDGSVYRARKVHYDTQGKVLRSIGPFSAYRGEDWVRGVDFVYRLRAKRTEARQVEARYRLSELKRRKRE